MLTFVASPPGRPDPADTSMAGGMQSAILGAMNLEWLSLPARMLTGSPCPVVTALAIVLRSSRCPPSPDACTTAPLPAETVTVPLAVLPRCWFASWISPSDVIVGHLQGVRELAWSVGVGAKDWLAGSVQPGFVEVAPGAGGELNGARGARFNDRMFSFQWDEIRMGDPLRLAPRPGSQVRMLLVLR